MPGYILNLVSPCIAARAFINLSYFKTNVASPAAYSLAIVDTPQCDHRQPSGGVFFRTSRFRFTLNSRHKLFISIDIRRFLSDNKIMNGHELIKKLKKRANDAWFLRPKIPATVFLGFVGLSKPRLLIYSTRCTN